MIEHCKCGKLATWVYMPKSEDYPFYCDKCVPRGCSCNLEPKDGNWDNSEDDNWYQPLDELGRKYPCVEFELIN